MAERWWTSDTVALVTGGNRGIGLEIVRSLAKAGLTTILASRNASQGQEIVSQLNDEGLFAVHHRLDISDSGSIDEIARWAKEQFGGIDILVNNAAVMSNNFSELLNLKRAKTLIETNYYGTKRMIEAFLPLMRPGGRIINISSVGSRLDLLQGNASQAWAAKLSSIENLTEATIDEFIQAFYDAVSKGADHLIAQGWPAFAFPIPGFPHEDYADYCVSKMAVTALTRLLARDLETRKSKIFVNAFCPGLCLTEMSLQCGHPAEQGADTAIWLALLPDQECKSGKFFVQRKEVDFRCAPLACRDKLGETFETIAELLYPMAAFRAAQLKSQDAFQQASN